MPRKRVATPAQLELAERSLDAALSRSPAAISWEAARRAARLALVVSPQSAAFGRATEIFLLASINTADLVCRDPALDGYFQGADRITHVWRWVVQRAATAADVAPEAVMATLGELLVWTPRGARPGMTPAEFAILEPAARDKWRDTHNGHEPKDVDMWQALSISRATYYRLKGRDEL